MKTRSSITGTYQCRYCPQTRKSPGEINHHYRQDHPVELRKARDAKRMRNLRDARRALALNPPVPAPDPVGSGDPRQCTKCNWRSQVQKNIGQSLAMHSLRKHTEHGIEQTKTLGANFRKNLVRRNGSSSNGNATTVNGANFEFSFNGRDFKELVFAIKGVTNAQA